METNLQMKKKTIPNKILFKHNFPIMFYNKEIDIHYQKNREKIFL